MWERFSYYGMRAMLVLFLTSATLKDGFGWTTSEALRLYGTYTSLVYVTPIFGGWLADNFLGQKRSMMIGAIFMAFGHFTMGGPGYFPYFVELFSNVPVQAILVDSGATLGELFISSQTLNVLQQHIQSICQTDADAALYVQPTIVAYLLSSWSFHIAIMLLITGNCLFKAPMATMVGLLYEKNDPRRDSAYTFHYAGANMGAFLAVLVAGTVGERFGWHYGFTVAGFGMLIGLSTFLWKKDTLLRGIGDKIAIDSNERASESEVLSSIERDRLKALLVFCAAALIFLAGYEQAAGLFNIYTYGQTDRFLGGFEIPATWFLSVNTLLVISLAPLFGWLWIILARRNQTPTLATKFSIGYVLLGLGFLLMVFAVLESQTAESGKSGMIWIVLVVVLHTLAELFIFPTAYSMVYRLSPARHNAMWMGMWFGSFGIGSWLASRIGAASQDFGLFTIFSGFVGMSITAVLALWMVRRKLFAWMHQPAHSKQDESEVCND